MPSISPSLGSFQNFQAIAPSSDPFIARAKFHHTPPDPSFCLFTPRENSSTHPTNHPYYSPTQAPYTYPTQTPSHTWAILGRLRSPMGHTVLIFQAGSHFRVQYWMPVPDSSPRYSRESSRAQGLISYSYPPNTHITLSL